MISREQVEKIKEGIVGQIESSFPEEKKAAAKEEILSMTDEEIEEFIEKNSLGGSNPEKGQKCIFCSISEGETESVSIGEIPEAVAVLEINPMSDAHSIVIPKKHVSSKNEISKKILDFADKISKKLKSKFKAKEVSISFSNVFGHEIINLIPIYGNEKPSEKKAAKKEDLLEIQKKFLEKKEKVISKPKAKEIKNSEKLWLPRRIP